MDVQAAVPCSPAATKNPTGSPLLETVHQVEQQLRSYITEQRSRDAFCLTDAAENASSTSPSDRTVTENNQSERDRHWVIDDDITLEEIFDTPECRTEISPSRTSFCRLKRCPATVYKPSRLGEVYTSGDSTECAYHSPTRPSLTERISWDSGIDCGDGSGAVTAAINPEEARSLSSTEEHVAGHDPLCRSPRQARAYNANDVPILLNPLVSKFNRASTDPLPQSTFIREERSPLRQASTPSMMDEEETSSGDEPNPSVNSSVTDLASCSESESGHTVGPSSSTTSLGSYHKRRVSAPVGTIGEKKKKKAHSGHKKSKSVAGDQGDPNKTPTASRSRNSVIRLPSPSPAKAKEYVLGKTQGMSEGVADLISGFRRLEVQELAPDDEEMNRPKSFLDHDGKRVPRPKSTSPERSEAQPTLSKSVFRPALHINTKGKSKAPKEVTAVAAAIDEEEITLPAPPRMGAVARPPILSTIPESSPVREAHRSSVTAAPSPLKLPARTPSLTRTPSLKSPPIRHGPIRLNLPPTDDAKRAAQNSDWIAFQMAISGPTGDYLQGGDSPVVLDAELADDLCAWFGSYGYSSEGRWVDRYDWRDALPAPVELPGSDVYTRSWRSSFSSTQSAGSSCSAGSVAPAAASSGAADKGDKRGKKRESAMSCNLNDLSDFLGFDVGCNGAWDDDCATPMELEARELMGELA